MKQAVPAALLVLAACRAEQPVVIDGSSEERFVETTSAARRQLPDADRMVFDRALRTVGGRRHSVRDAQGLARVTFDRMTAADVVADQRARGAGDEMR